MSKGLRVLEFLASQTEPVGVSEVARGCGLTKTTAHRNLQVLIENGYVSKDRSGYSLNLRLWTIANASLRKFDIRDAARSHMADLCQVTNEVVHLSMLHDDRVVIMDKVDAAQPLQAHAPVGSTGPAHCLATGKAILAYVEDSYVDLKMNHLKAYTNRTIRTKTALRQALAQIRRDGFAVANGEWFENIVGIAAPIMDALGKPVAAIGIAGPTDRLTKAIIAEFAPRVVAAARSISSTLGQRN